MTDCKRLVVADCLRISGHSFGLSVDPVLSVPIGFSAEFVGSTNQFAGSTNQIDKLLSGVQEQKSSAAISDGVDIESEPEKAANISGPSP